MNKEEKDLKFLLEMAYDREGFKNKIQQFVGGSLKEYSKARLAEKNNLPQQDIDFWYKEVHGRLDEMFEVLTTEIKNFSDRKSAFREAIEYYKKRNANYASFAKRKLEQLYKINISLKNVLHEEDFDQYWELVQEEWDEAEALHFEPKEFGED